LACSFFTGYSLVVQQPHNKQLPRTVVCHRGDTASAPFHYVLAVHFTGELAAAQLQRYTQSTPKRTRQLPQRGDRT
jgi:hypothetical protein